MRTIDVRQSNIVVLLDRISPVGLRPDLWEWQLVNPASSVGKTGFRAGEQRPTRAQDTHLTR